MAPAALCEFLPRRSTCAALSRYRESEAQTVPYSPEVLVAPGHEPEVTRADFKDGTKEDGSTKPKNIYGEAKLAGERLTKLFQKRDNLDYVIVRPSGVYGPGDMPDRVVSKFFEKAMKNDPITLHNGENKVDFTYVEDTVQGIIKAATSSVANVSFNITAGNATSLRTLANTIIEITNSESELEDTGNHKLYPMRGTLDISRAKDLIEYEPQYELKKGLEKYYEWIRQYTGKV